ncbi:poly-beta-1,6-N-acetyl-D-glucosamine N-deacetylase PgaB [Pseudomonas sp.]|uniref:poly-beta-1,6-N-acetyl-D-glucosamine N-deacetylase PgaB n=1 Tax=Pseudomonas sp. TaxID=306 RepID=UPI00272BA09B|nr:poly-beta-1,6-N-acetyl-D-glucosamine N-deacetylase PgaB [Pseudomonas sp.]
MKIIGMLAIALITLAGCSQQPVPFQSPVDRPLAARELPWPPGQVLALAYHDVEDVSADNTFMSVRTANLVEQFAWLRENGYQPVSVDQILAARNGGAELPPKAVLLTFDDGFSSFAERVLPILKAYGWPAVLAPVGAWLDAPSDLPVDFGGTPVPRSRFVSADQLLAIHRSGLVEIGAHTYNLHFGAQANPQGNVQPSAAVRLFDPETGLYETEKAYRERIAADVKAITSRLEQITGKAPRVWVWPYGEASGSALQIVDENGYEIALTLVRGLSSMATLTNGHRILIDGDPDTRRFASNMVSVQERPEKRVAHVDLDYVYDSNPEQLDANLGLLVQRIADLRISTVFLQAYADPEGDGTVRELYFPNRHLPMRADLFNRVAWQLRTRAGVEVYAWMPVLSFDLDPALPRVVRLDPVTGASGIDGDQYARLSPFNPEVRRQIGEIYEDLAGHAIFAGILFHDDALLSDFEDVGPDALAAYRAAGLGDDIVAIRSDPNALHAWTRFKSRYLVDFTMELTSRVRAVRGPEVKTARNIFALPILQPESEAWFAQNLDDFLESYDWTAPMAMPFMEGVKQRDADSWLSSLVAEVARRPGALERTVFELQARNWRTEGHEPIDSHLLARWMRVLQWNGVRHFGYYPDDFHLDQPALEVVRPILSNAWSPIK